MTNMDALLEGYENTKLLHYLDAAKREGELVPFDRLSEYEGDGVLKMNLRKPDGKLWQLYSEQGNHVGVIAATRLGKTSSYVIPTVLSFARQKRKKSMLISDPKGEIYRHTAGELQRQGYDVKLINIRDALHSEFWNPLTPIFREYRKVCEIADSVETVKTPKGLRNRFFGKIYEDQAELDRMIARRQRMAMGTVEKDVEALSHMLIPVRTMKDPYWEKSAGLTLQGFLWAMLEDSREETRVDIGIPPITENTFSFSTLFSVYDQMRCDHDFHDGGYFSKRRPDSRAYKLVKNVLLENATMTRHGVVTTFNTAMAAMREASVRTVTICNSFEISSLIEKPTAVFIDYKDEEQAHYQVISLFVQDAYRRLITMATERESGALDVPFYFILDEFGNFPEIENFKTVISAAAGRAVYFILILQSYAQLEAVYGKDTAEIIRDNLNVQVMLGTNNPSTLEEFSKSCREYTRISPLSAVNGNADTMNTYQVETIRLLPRSRLAHFSPGECVVTEANCPYVLWSRMERYYLCDEYKGAEMLSEMAYKAANDPFDDAFIYEANLENGNFFDDD